MKLFFGWHRELAIPWDCIGHSKAIYHFFKLDGLLHIVLKSLVLWCLMSNAKKLKSTDNQCCNSCFMCFSSVYNKNIMMPLNYSENLFFISRNILWPRPELSCTLNTEQQQTNLTSNKAGVAGNLNWLFQALLYF